MFRDENKRIELLTYVERIETLTRKEKNLKLWFTMSQKTNNQANIYVETMMSLEVIQIHHKSLAMILKFSIYWVIKCKNDTGWMILANVLVKNGELFLT